MGAITNFTGRLTAGSGVCRQVRERLCAAGPATDNESHLASCAECAAFAQRLVIARQLLGRPLAPDAQPDPSFPARVSARIQRPGELIGWAAFRALPAAMALALALAWVGFSTPSSPGAPGAPGAPSPAPGGAVPTATATLAAATTANAAAASSLLEDAGPSADQLIAWSLGGSAEGSAQ